MKTPLYIAGEFYGIQKYVLGISAAGAGQAKRLRARSFHVQVLGEVVVRRISEAFAKAASTSMMEGGGQFVLEVESSPAAKETLASLRTTLQSELLLELQGQLGLNIAWADTLAEALRLRSRERRRSWSHVMAGPSGWVTSQMSRPSIAPPCEICGKLSATRQWQDGDLVEAVCTRCDEDRRTGALIPWIHSISLATNTKTGPIILGRRVRLDRQETYGAKPVYRRVPLDSEEKLLTFEQIADTAPGVPLLGVLKADVDDLGGRIASQMVDAAGSQDLSELSRSVDRFFSLSLQNKLRRDSRPIFTVFSGGDDLFLVGAWNDMLAVAIETHDAFWAGPGAQYNLTISAGVAFTPPGIPVRNAASRAERLLPEAKKGPKNQCATLDGVWQWDEIARICRAGRILAHHVNDEVAPRALLHRFFRILSGSEEMAPSQWAYHLTRHFRARRARTREQSEFQDWCEAVDELWIRPKEPRAARDLQMARATLLYALVATRSRRESHEWD
jgi:CRISPR-associated protein Csm1